MLGPEDAISIVLLRHGDLSASAVIPPDGKILVPIVGEIMPTGETGGELAKHIANGLPNRVSDPEVGVMLRVPRVTRVYVLSGRVLPAVSADTTQHNAVPMPAGVFHLKPGWRVSELLAASTTDRRAQEPRRIRVTASPTPFRDTRKCSRG